jgi:lipase chaperone LimK
MNKRITIAILSTVSICALLTFQFNAVEPLQSEATQTIAPSPLATTPNDINHATLPQPDKQPAITATVITTDVDYSNYQSAFGPLPKSLRGTRIPAAFTLGPEGHLVITSSIKSIIEYFLSGVGEDSIDTIIGRIEEFFTQQLNEPARSEALDVLKQYISYKTSLLELETDLADNTQLSGQNSDYRTMFQYRREARMNSLSPEIYDAFFAHEDQEDHYTASLLDIRKNQDLSDADKASQYEAAEQLLPDAERAVKQAQRARQTLNKDIEVAKNEGANAEEIFQMRAEVYGFDAAERFAQADDKKAMWQTRIKRYQEQRQHILNNQGLSPEDKAHEIMEIQTDQFSQREQLRLSTLDTLHDQEATL